MKLKRPVKETLNTEYVIQSAIKLIDRDGLNSFSMRKLSSHIGVTPMALYRYFDSKDSLFDGITEFVWKSLVPFPITTIKGNWKQILIELMFYLRQKLLEHPSILPLVSTHPITTITEFKLVDQVLAILNDNGLKINKTTIFLFNTLTAYTLGFVWNEAVEPHNKKKCKIDEFKQLCTESKLLEQFLEPLQSGNAHNDHQFKMGLIAILNGWK